MSWLRRLLGKPSTVPSAPAPPLRPAAPPSPARIPEMLDGRAKVEVKGEASYQSALTSIARGKRDESASIPVVATLRCEPTNPYDANAIIVEVEGLKVGYLRRDLAVDYCPLFSKMEREGRQPSCKGTIVGGWKRDDGDEGMFGIWLKMPSPELLARQLSEAT